ncbi:MAG: hydantoinase/oxoprolinase family protein [Magnetovibrio sp.]|nr:hydantoinase/oxoprolinase family protein [Magnetovibrio sp.]
MGAYSLGIDIGGTFTDVVAYEHATGRQLNRKVLTTHGDPAEAVMTGLDAVLAAGRLEAGQCRRLVHATTLFTNALIERKGALTGLLTTEGFRDALEIGRERKYALYDLAIEKPAPLVPRPLRREVPERTDWAGQVLAGVDVDALIAEARALVEAGAEALAIVFLHAYANDANERAAAGKLRDAFPGLSITASHEVAPEIREYERASTTAANAYVMPLAARYLASLAERAAARGIAAPLHLMLSAGGLTHLDEAKRVPVEMLESGPAAGALAAAFFGRPANGAPADDLLAFDMGGTTAKLALIEDGQPRTAYAFEAARARRFAEGSGLPIRISTVELIEIGAGGGSIARLDALGLLKVGPDSAGSEPGPASYGLGGTEPTVTDADFALGYLDPAGFAGGDVAIDAEAGASALAGLARAAGLTPDALAWGIHDIVNENMASAARVHIAERGRDPRSYALLSTGGAGPVHAYGVARKLGVVRIICPPAAGVASALGLLVAPARVDRVTTVGLNLTDGDPAALEAAFAGLEADARNVLAGTGLALDRIEFRRFADGRFVGQGFDLVIGLPPGPYNGADADAVRGRLAGAFEAAYRERFNRTPPDVPIEFINARLSARLPVTGADGGAEDPGAGPDRAGDRTRPAYFPDAGGFVETRVVARADLAAGAQLAGPLIVEDAGSTLVAGPGAGIAVLANGNVVVTMPETGGGGDA